MAVPETLGERRRFTGRAGLSGPGNFSAVSGAVDRLAPDAVMTDIRMRPGHYVGG